jgi:RimJ/RimL family protein N-acetyltransferase
MLGDEPVGQARFRIQREEAVISVLLDRRFRGLKKGAELIQCATGKLFNESPLQTVHAYLKAGNKASYQSFIHAGYHDSGSIMIHGQDAHHLIFHRRGL